MALLVFFFFLSQSQRNNCPLCWGVRKARKLDFLIFFFLEPGTEIFGATLILPQPSEWQGKDLCTGQLQHVWFWQGRGSELCQLSYCISESETVKRQLLDYAFFCRDQAIGCFDQSLKSACPVQNSTMKKYPSPKLRCDMENEEVLKYVCVNVKHAQCWLCHRQQHVLVKGKQEEILAAHLQTRLSAKIDASREAWKETTGQATLYFLSKALSLTKKAKLIVLGAHILQACCNAQRA